MLYDKKMPSLKDEIIEQAENTVLNKLEKNKLKVEKNKKIKNKKYGKAKK